MATAKQIAARKKFAERARSGELARMRKKSTTKKPTRAASRKANPDKTQTKALQIAQRNFETAIDQAGEYESLTEALDVYRANVIDTLEEEGITDDFSIRKALNRFDQMADAEKAIGTKPKRKRNPTATRAASRKANPISDVAQTIYQQLGANRFVAMTGAKNFVAGENYLMFSIPRNMSPYNKVKITYIAGRDLYDVDFMKVTRAGGVAKGEPYNDVYAENLRDLFRNVTGMETSLGTMGRRSNPTATRAPARSRTKLMSNGGRKSNPATKDVFFVNVIDDGGFQFGMDDRTPVLFKFSNREMKKGVYQSFALPFNVTSNAEFQNFVKSLPGNQIVISLKDLRKQLSAYA